MICLDGLNVLDFVSLSSILEKIGVSIINQVFKNPSSKILTQACFELPGPDSYLPLITPLIVKFVFVLLIFLVLHFFSVLIPDKM